MRLLFALFALFFAVPGWAATYKLDVTGYYETVTLLSASAQVDDGSTVSVGNVVYAPDAPEVDALGFDFVQGTTGTAVYDGLRYSNCTGLISILCFGVPTFMPNKYSSSNEWGGIIVTDTTLYYEDDASYSWLSGGVQFFTSTGMRADGVVTSLTVSEVPLPAGGILLIAAFLTLRHFGKKTAFRKVA